MNPKCKIYLENLLNKNKSQKKIIRTIDLVGPDDESPIKDVK